MDVMTFIPTLDMIRTNSIDEHQRNFSRRAHRVCNENERTNLLAITQLVLNTFLDDQIRGSKTRMLDAVETREISDFFIMLEKCLWHGFKVPASSFVGRRRQPEAEIWHFLELASNAKPEMAELYKSVCEMTNLSTPLSKFRAFWRLAMMQKKLADYFECLYESGDKEHFYETWALLRADCCAFLSGTFLALSVFDCNLLIDHDQLQEQINSFDLTPYLRMPTLPGQLALNGEEEEGCSSNNVKPEEDGQYTELKTILDQKQYLEERNRQLSVNIAQLKCKLEKAATSENGSLNDGSNKSLSDDRSLVFTERLKDMEKERDILRARLAEKEDNLRISQDQLEGTRRFTKDLYEKLRAADSKIRRLQNDIKELKELHEREIAQLTATLHSLREAECQEEAEEDKDDEVEEDGQQKRSSNNNMAQIRHELVDKTREYADIMAALKRKHDELSDERENVDALRRRCAELDARVDTLAHVEEDLIAQREENKRQWQELAESKQALQEFSEALSESKLRMVELKEEIMPLSEAQWVKDSETVSCRLCETQFSVLHRRHHCRNCGQIFCNSCARGRVKLPSSSNPVRVCLNCYHLLRNRQLSIASLVDPRNTAIAGTASSNASTSSLS